MNINTEKQPHEILPPADTPVWRYMSLAKFIAILQTQSLYLCRADIFDDIFEGSFTEESLRESELDYQDNHVSMFQWIPSRSFVSCWHASEVESVALWKIYGRDEGSLSIKSSIGALQKAFPSIIQKDDMLIISQDVRRIQYIDYRTVHPQLNDLAAPLCYKRLAFSFEQEIRVIRQELQTVSKPRDNQPDGRAISIGVPSDSIGRNIAVDLEELIESVYLAPSSPSWLLPTVKGIMRVFGFSNIPCQQSNLDDLPEFIRIGVK